MADEKSGDVNTLEFRGFEDCPEGAPQFLMNQEVTVLLDQIKMEREKMNIEPPRIIMETLEYCKSRGGSNLGAERIKHFCGSIRQKLEELYETDDKGVEQRLHPYEVATIVNLMDTDSDADECLELVPSLKAEGRFSGEFIEQLLELVKDEKKELNLT